MIHYYIYTSLYGPEVVERESNKGPGILIHTFKPDNSDEKDMIIQGLQEVAAKIQNKF